MRKGILMIGFLLVFSFACYAETSSSSINWLTKLYADTLYCRIGGDCSFNLLNVTVMNVNSTNTSEINTSLIRVDHIAEKTSGHKIVFDNSIQTNFLPIYGGSYNSQQDDGFGGTLTTTYSAVGILADPTLGFDIQADNFDVTNIGGGSTWLSCTGGLCFTSVPYQFTSLTSTLQAEFGKPSTVINQNICLQNGSYCNLTRADLTGNTYVPFQNKSIAGTIPDGNISLMRYYDSRFYNISEVVVGSDNLLLYVNFSNVTSINRIGVRYLMDSANDYVNIYLNSTSGQLESYGKLSPTMETEVVTFDVPDPLNHILDGGNVQIVLKHFGTAGTNHKLSLDYIWLLDGYVPLSSSETDPHFVGWYNNSHTLLTNLTVNNSLIVHGNINLTNNITSTAWINRLNSSLRISGNGTAICIGLGC